MYSGCDYLLSLKSCSCAFWYCHPYFILQFYSIVFILVYVLFYCMSATKWEVPKFARARKVVATPLVNSPSA